MMSLMTLSVFANNGQITILHNFSQFFILNHAARSQEISIGIDILAYLFVLDQYHTIFNVISMVLSKEQQKEKETRITKS